MARKDNADQSRNVGSHAADERNRRDADTARTQTDRDRQAENDRIKQAKKEWS